MKYYIEGEGLPTNLENRVQNLEDADVFVIKGGDGTLLREIKKIYYVDLHKIIVMGINTGHVGFLSNDLKPEEAASFLSLPYEEFITRVSQRSLLGTNYSTVKALNEIVIQPVNRGKLLELSVEVNKEMLTYKGDGIIISTASGSTAYNLSAGGPIISPDMHVMNITPLCPFTLASRPIVVSYGSIITVSSKNLVEVTIDGDKIGTEKIKDMRIEIASETLSLFKVDMFFNAIQNKLGWNRSIK